MEDVGAASTWKPTSTSTPCSPIRYKRHFSAPDGRRGEGRLKHGKDGKDITLPVPVGTQVWADEAHTRLLVDLDEPGQRFLAAKGGGGGAGNTHYATPTNRFPLLAQAGERGEELSLRLELKLLADVGIVGAPNAGKSSLLSVVSAARPKVANYPFTTLEPSLGMIEHRGETFVMVDIPGLIEGAHEGVGLGHEFLRHIERTRVLVHLVDGSLDDPIAQYHPDKRRTLPIRPATSPASPRSSPSTSSTSPTSQFCATTSTTPSATPPEPTRYTSSQP